MKLAAVSTPTNLDATGQCYSDAGSLITMPFGGEHDTWTLVHGRPTLRFPPHIEYGHAWLESPDNSTVYDPTINTSMEKELYYALGNIEENNSHRYNRDETKEKINEFKHWGPWEGVDAVPPLTD